MIVSIIIVNYNTADMLYECLESIVENITCGMEVIVADNASTDDSLSRCIAGLQNQKIRYIPLGRNCGFAAANNMAAEKATGEILHFLNPDTKVSGTLNADYATAAANPQYVYVNPLINRDGTVENGAMPLPFIGNIFRWIFCRSKARCWYKGASVIISAENFNRAGRWCEDYFMYAEDLDLFYTLSKKGIETREAASPIFHYGGGSSSKKWSAVERETLVQRSMRLFYRKNSNMFQYFAVKFYYLLHYLFKNPRRIPSDLKAWFRSFSKEQQ